jgi:hypothetical protein
MIHILEINKKNLMKKISETEENEMYRILSEGIYSLCETKPQNAIEHLAKKLLEISGEHPDLLRRFSKKQKVDANLFRKSRFRRQKF